MANSDKPTFFSKANLRKMASSATALIPFIKKSEPIKEMFSLSEVRGVGFLEDFVVYSKIPAKFWHNASPGQRQMTVINNATMGTIMYNMMTGTSGSVTTGSLYISSNDSIGSSFLINQDGQQPTEAPSSNEVAVLPQATQAIEGKVLPEGTLLTPKQVFHELERIPTPFNLLDIEKKAALYKSALGLIRNGGGGGIANTLKDIQCRLDARVKYRNNKENRTFFDQFQNTNDEKIEALLIKHEHLRIGPADDFIPEMPEDAIEIMVNYAQKTLDVSGSKPVFYLIAKDEDFKRKKEARGKRDPILLAQSPFGFYWQVLGAWDEEMMLLDEI